MKENLSTLTLETGIRIAQYKERQHQLLLQRDTLLKEENLTAVVGGVPEETVGWEPE